MKKLDTRQVSQPITRQKDMVIEWLKEMKAEGLTVMCISSISTMADYFIISSGNSQTHLRSMATHVQKSWSKKYKFRTHIEGMNSEWILIDTGAIVLHLMSHDARRFYDLESLWSPELWQEHYG